MRSRSMVSPRRIAKIADTLKKPVSMDYGLELGVACFEEGMMEILRHVAEQDFNQDCGHILMSAYSKEMNRIAEEKYEELQSVLDCRQQGLLKQYDEAYRNLSGSEVNDYFIVGFIRGYRFLRNHIIFDQNIEFEEEA